MESEILSTATSRSIVDPRDTRLADDAFSEEDSADSNGNNGKKPPHKESGLSPTRSYEIKDGSEVSDLQLNHLKHTPHFLRRANETFISHGKWIGEVIERNGETFKTRVREYGERSYSKEVEFLVSDIGYNDRKFIRKGSIFYWSVGYFNRPSGRSRESLVTFRRLPYWTSGEIKSAKERAKIFRDSIKGDDGK